MHSWFLQTLPWINADIFYTIQIRRKMREIMVNQASSCDLKELVRKFIPESIGKEIEKATSSIYPLQNVFIRKVKILKAPKFDLGKLMEVFILFISHSLFTSYNWSSTNKSISELLSSIRDFCLLIGRPCWLDL